MGTFKDEVANFVAFTEAYAKLKSTEFLHDDTVTKLKVMTTKFFNKAEVYFDKLDFSKDEVIPAPVIQPVVQPIIQTPIAQPVAPVAPTPEVAAAQPATIRILGYTLQELAYQRVATLKDVANSISASDGANKTIPQTIGQSETSAHAELLNYIKENLKFYK